MTAGPKILGEKEVGSDVLEPEAAKRFAGQAEAAKISQGREDDYPSAAAAFFQETFPHRLRWAHAVNGRAELAAALSSQAQLLEADVASGEFVRLQHVGQYGGTASWAEDPVDDGVQVRTPGDEPVLMAHAPLQGESDLTFEEFIQEVALHNQRALPVANFLDACPRSASAFSRPVVEAVKFSDDLEEELASSPSMFSIGSCGGSRRAALGQRLNCDRKGVKLDFKNLDCVGPVLEHIRDKDFLNSLGGHLWLNADIVAGPGALLEPLNPNVFVALCAQLLPEAVLSLSWGASALSSVREYTREMVDSMILLCRTPLDQLVPEEEGFRCHSKQTAHQRCRHITFAVSADYVLDSISELRRLLRELPGSSLTIFSGFGGFSVTPEIVRKFLSALSGYQVFLDIKLSSNNALCTVQ